MKKASEKAPTEHLIPLPTARLAFLMSDKNLPRLSDPWPDDQPISICGPQSLDEFHRPANGIQPAGVHPPPRDVGEALDPWLFGLAPALSILYTLDPDISSALEFAELVMIKLHPHAHSLASPGLSFQLPLSRS